MDIFSVGYNIRCYMLKNHISIRSLSRQAVISYNKLSRFLDGSSCYISLLDYLKICEVLDVDCKEFLKNLY